jgi:hypothetical protein
VKILGLEVETAGVWEHIQDRLRARGLELPASELLAPPPVEPRVDPIQHHLEGLTEHGDSTQALPLHTHRTGLGRGVLWAKWVFRKVGQPLINEALGRQRLFNAHVRDAYAELAARVERLSAELEALQAAKAPRRKRAAKPRKRAAEKTG